MSNIIIPTTDEIDLVLRKYRNEVYNRNQQEYTRAIAHNVEQSSELINILNQVITRVNNIQDEKVYTLTLAYRMFQAGLQVGLDIKRGYN